MNKKIKAIELLNEMANNENYHPKVKYQEMTYIYHNDIGDYTNDFNGEYGIFSGWALNLMLNNEVEILEDNTEEIEELIVSDEGFIKAENGCWKGRKLDVAFANKINEIIRYIKRKDKSND